MRDIDLLRRALDRKGNLAPSAVIERVFFGRNPESTEYIGLEGDGFFVTEFHNILLAFQNPLFKSRGYRFYSPQSSIIIESGTFRECNGILYGPSSETLPYLVQPFKGKEGYQNCLDEFIEKTSAHSVALHVQNSTLKRKSGKFKQDLLEIMWGNRVQTSLKRTLREIESTFMIRK